jgi:predicted negative regulator of RcsB-dependent stress response
VEAKVEAAAGKTDDALRSIEETIASAKKSGYLGYQLEAQFALGEVQMASGRAGAGLSLLAEVRRQAQQKGFQLIAYETTRVSGKSPAVQTKAVETKTDPKIN